MNSVVLIVFFHRFLSLAAKARSQEAKDALKHNNTKAGTNRSGSAWLLHFVGID
jgi:hypothetical protein